MSAPAPPVDTGFFGPAPAKVPVAENLTVETIVIPHGDTTTELRDLVIGPLARREIPRPEEWRRSVNLQRQVRLGRVAIFEASEAELMPPPPVPETIRGHLLAVDLEKARQMVINP